MNVSKLRNSTAIGKALAMTVVNNGLKVDVKDDGASAIQVEKPALDLPPTTEITADSVSMYLKDVSASSCGEIDSLISDLRNLRAKLVADSSRIEHDVADFAMLNQSVVRLTEVVAESVAQVKGPSLAV